MQALRNSAAAGAPLQTPRHMRHMVRRAANDNRRPRSRRHLLLLALALVAAGATIFLLA